jgi:hypothetical protein
MAVRLDSLEAVPSEATLAASLVITPPPRQTSPS